MSVGAGLGIAVVLAGQALIAGGVVYLILRRLRAGKRRAEAGVIAPGPDGSVVIPLLASFAGLCAIPWVAVAGNSLNPYLAVSSTEVIYRVIRRRSRPLADIESVDVLTGPGTVNLEFRFRDRPMTLLTNVGSVAMAGAALRALPRSVPLTPRAARIRAGEA